MAFDPNLPANNSPIVSAELRGQFTALKALIDAKPSMEQVNDAIVASSAGSVSEFPPLAIFASNPPTQLEVQALINQLNDLLDTMKR